MPEVTDRPVVLCPDCGDVFRVGDVIVFRAKDVRLTDGALNLVPVHLQCERR